ncbi:glutathione S-transferase family protein [Mastigocoleus testarum]|uniref:Glutathione transferase n=1 Tax=Mastigocoleus testarum BC008 TaxID=371196 RepID=A0A0V7ZL69_9CYAN|nr:glutathione S-transferase family protein [Mastigocoleus testarum]KST65289.1 glutathione transferase [Mastigocoleus testarum BC008]KST65657.1 glutathione transferase [Mastigocoleus testarum BC008]
MLKFYYNPLSPMSRRVWRGLLEKEIPFEPILVELNGDHLQPDYLAINPFHHVPVIIDDGLRILESIAILEYLELKYPTPALLPTNIQEIATVRMVQMVSTNELLAKVVSLIFEAEDSPQFIQAREHIDKVLGFLVNTLQNKPYFGGEQLSLADIVLGTDVSLLPKLGVDFCNYPTLNRWFERLMERPIWEQTKLSDRDFQEFKRRVRILAKMRKRELSRTGKTN